MKALLVICAAACTIFGALSFTIEERQGTVIPEQSNGRSSRSPKIISDDQYAENFTPHRIEDQAGDFLSGASLDEAYKMFKKQTYGSKEQESARKLDDFNRFGGGLVNFDTYKPAVEAEDRASLDLDFLDDGFDKNFDKINPDIGLIGFSNAASPDSADSFEDLGGDLKIPFLDVSVEDRVPDTSAEQSGEDRIPDYSVEDLSA